MFGVGYSRPNTHLPTHIYRLCVVTCIGVSVQEVEGAAPSHGVFCGMPLPAPSPSHEMGKHEIKVEKTYKGVEGG